MGIGDAYVFCLLGDGGVVANIIIILCLFFLIIIFFIIIFIIQQDKISTEEIERNGNRTQTYYCCFRPPARSLLA